MVAWTRIPGVRMGERAGPRMHFKGRVRKSC